MNTHALNVRLSATAVLAAGAGLLAGCGTDDATPETKTETITQTAGSQSPAASSAAPSRSGVDLAATAPAVSWRDALRTAGAQFTGSPTAVKLETEHGRTVYEIELASATQESDITIDAANGGVVAKTTDDLHGDDAAHAGAERFEAGEVTVEPDRAMRAAQARVAGPVSEWKLHRENGRLVYEINVGTAGDDTEVVVDAATGEVIGTDR